MFIILVIAAILRLISLNQSFWLDEAIQAVISTKPLTLVNWAADFQPPFFYLFTHFWMKIGNSSEWFLRLPSVFFGVVTVYLTYYLFTRMFNKSVGIISALLLATAPFHIYYSQEFRMYSLLATFVLLSWIFLWEKRLIFYTLTIIIALYTHYFAFIVIFSQLIYILLTRKITIYQYIKVLGGAFIPFLLWLPIFQKQIASAQNLIFVWPRWQEVSNVSFLKFPGLFLAKTTVGMISPQSRALYSGAVLVVGVIFLISLYKIAVRIWNLEFNSRTKFHAFIFLFCYFFIPLIIAWVSGLFISANSPHRLLFVLPAFYGILTVGLTGEKPNRRHSGKRGASASRISNNLDSGVITSFFPRMTAITLVMIINLYFVSLYLLNPHYHHEDWRSAVLYTDQKIGPAQSAARRALLGEGSYLPGGGQTLSLFVEPWAPIIWYSKKPSQNIGASTTLHITNESIASRLDPLLSNIREPISSIYLYTYLFELSDPQKKVEAYLTEHGYKLTEEKDFRGVGIIKKLQISL